MQQINVGKNSFPACQLLYFSGRKNLLPKSYGVNTKKSMHKNTIQQQMWSCFVAENVDSRSKYFAGPKNEGCHRI